MKITMMVALAGCVFAPFALAVPITYTVQAIASGSLGGTNFTNAQVTLTSTQRTLPTRRLFSSPTMSRRQSQ